MAQAADLTENLKWLGHAGFRIEGSRSVYLDPYLLQEKDPKPADLILVTHEHFDHFAPEDLEKILTPETVTVSIEKVTRRARGRTHTIRVGETTEVRGVKIRAVPAYNLHKDRLRFHPKADGKVGYLVTVDSVTYYHAGDTDFIPEMKGLECDVALLPVSGVYVMDAPEAARAARAIQAKVVVPMHYGTLEGVGRAEDARRFREFLRETGLSVRILPLTR